MSDIRVPPGDKSLQQCWDEAIEKASAIYDNQMVRLSVAVPALVNLSLIIQTKLCSFGEISITYAGTKGPSYQSFYLTLISALLGSSNNCHSHVATALNDLNFKGIRYWNTFLLILFMMFNSSFVKYVGLSISIISNLNDTYLDFVIAAGDVSFRHILVFSLLFL